MLFDLFLQIFLGMMEMDVTVFNTKNKMDASNVKERPRLRKKILNKRKANQINIFNHIPISTHYDNVTSVQHDNENLNPYLLIQYQQSNNQYIDGFTDTNLVDNDAKHRRKRRKNATSILTILEVQQHRLMSIKTEENKERCIWTKEDPIVSIQITIQLTVIDPHLQMYLQSASNFSQTTPLYNNSSVMPTLNYNLQPISLPNRDYSTFSYGTMSRNSSAKTINPSTELISTKQNLRRITPNISDTPKVHIRSNEDLREQQNIDNSILGVSQVSLLSDYVDHGDQTHICTICHAKLWKVETLRGNRSGKRTSFSICGDNGKVQPPELKETPIDYQDLFHSNDAKTKFFFKNIRRFNSMFSFTSMGGRVDNSINRGNATYIYRLSGKNYHCLGSLLPPNGSQLKFSQRYIYDTENEISNRQDVTSQKLQ
ncbi:hypothetical protein LXL04_034294 [Taraxacum kok-saghyz]